MFFTLVSLIISVILIFIKKKYFTLYGPIPGLPPTLFFGNLIDTGQLFRGVSLNDALRNMSKRLGNTFRLWLGTSNVIVVGDAKDVQYIFSHRNIYEQGIDFIQKVSIIYPNGMMSLEGSAFKRHAAVTIPIFRRAKITPYNDLLIEMSDRLLNRWRKQSTGTIYTDIPKQCQLLLLQIFGYIGFDYDLKVLTEDGDDNQTKDELTNAVHNIFTMFQFMFFAPRFFSVIYTKFSKRYRNARETADKYINQLVEKELNMNDESRQERKRSCLIASLVDAMEKNETGELKKSDENRKGLTRQEIVDESLLFLIAGYETTATALAWSIFWLSKNPQVQQKIKKELLNYGGQHTLNFTIIENLTYLDCVIKEVLRMSPPISGTMRTLTCDDRLPESGYLLRKGESVLIPIENLSHDPRYWTIDPEKFVPERFLDEDKDHNPYVLLPFGSGHRSCIGQDLARLELKVIVARLMQHVTFIDGGPEVNIGGCSNKTLTTMPQKMAVSIDFDD